MVLQRIVDPPSRDIGGSSPSAPTIINWKVASYGGHPVLKTGAAVTRRVRTDSYRRLYLPPRFVLSCQTAGPLSIPNLARECRAKALIALSERTAPLYISVKNGYKILSVSQVLQVFFCYSVALQHRATLAAVSRNLQMKMIPDE